LSAEQNGQRIGKGKSSELKRERQRTLPREIRRMKDEIRMKSGENALLPFFHAEFRKAQAAIFDFQANESFHNL
jgi:hypothetical protein